MKACHLAALALGALTVVAFWGCGGESGSDAYGERNPVELSGAAVTVEMNALQFEPKGIKVKPGTTVTWVNKEPSIHNVRQVQSVFLSQDVMKEGDTFTYTFDEPGTYRYQCTYHHPSMNGVVIVEED